MRPFAFILALAVIGPPAMAETVLAARTVRAQSILAPGDVTLAVQDIPGTYAAIDEAVGLEARVVLYAGRPIRIEDLGPPAIVDRNQIVTLIYRAGGVAIAAEGRALARAGIGDSLRVMNLASRQTVTGLVRMDGTVSVGPLSPSLLPQE